MVEKNRLVKLFKNISDDTLKIIISDIVQLERAHRMSSRENFPKREIKDIIDKEARLIEKKNEKEE